MLDLSFLYSRVILIWQVNFCPNTDVMTNPEKETRISRQPLPHRSGLNWLNRKPTYAYIHFIITISLYYYHYNFCSRLTSQLMLHFIRILQETTTKSSNWAMRHKYSSGENPQCITQLKFESFLILTNSSKTPKRFFNSLLSTI